MQTPDLAFDLASVVIPGRRDDEVGQILAALDDARVAAARVQAAATIDLAATRIDRDLSDLWDDDPIVDQFEIDRHRSEALAAGAQRRMRTILSAYDRIAAGTYGRCADCGEPIALDRLLAVPEAVCCVDCAPAAPPGRRADGLRSP